MERADRYTELVVQMVDGMQTDRYFRLKSCERTEATCHHGDSSASREAAKRCANPALQRLGEYENTGLSPEEIEELKHNHEKLQDFEVQNNEQLQKKIRQLESVIETLKYLCAEAKKPNDSQTYTSAPKNDARPAIRWEAN